METAAISPCHVLPCLLLTCSFGCPDCYSWCSAFQGLLFRLPCNRCVFVLVVPLLSLHIVHRMAEANFLINSSLLQNWPVSTAVEGAAYVNTTKSVFSLPPSRFKSSKLTFI